MEETFLPAATLGPHLTQPHLVLRSESVRKLWLSAPFIFQALSPTFVFPSPRELAIEFTGDNIPSIVIPDVAQFPSNQGLHYGVKDEFKIYLVEEPGALEYYIPPNPPYATDIGSVDARVS